MSERGHWKVGEDGKLVPYVAERPTRQAPAIHTDEIPGGIRSMADRKTYTSKSKLRQSYRDLGYIEIGNETVKETPRPSPTEDRKYMEEVERDITTAYYQVRDGMAPLSELDKERCKIIDKQIEESHDNRQRDFLGNIIG